MLLSITGVQPRKLRVKDWQNAHGKVGIVDCQCHLQFMETRNNHSQYCHLCFSKWQDAFSALPSLFLKMAGCLLCELDLSIDITESSSWVSVDSAQFIFTVLNLTIFSALDMLEPDFVTTKVCESKNFYYKVLLFEEKEPL